MSPFARAKPKDPARLWQRGAKSHLLATTIMSPDAANDLSISDLFRLLGEKLGLECIKLRETPISPASPAISLGSEVSGITSPLQESSD